MKKKNEINKISASEAPLLYEGYKEQLETNPQYSLEVDPLDKYKFSAEQKKFIEYYIQLKNIPAAADLAGIDKSVANQIFMMYNTQQEIRRINLAMYHRQFSNKMLSIDEIGGWLTSILMDENVSLADTLSTKDKLSVAKILIELNSLKREALANPEIIDYTEVEEQLKDLSVNSIKQMLSNANSKKNREEKDKVLESIQEKHGFSTEEMTYLKSLPMKDLVELMNEGTKEDK